ncbi:MAG: cyclic nucleotide-binding domain-containing protein [Verrucomicrobiales bacterium]|nr:cyclic nucleotide-binding domain-containing protein [Verrucomicrobiales bacterium]
MKEYPLDCRPGSVPRSVSQIPFFREVDPALIEKLLPSVTVLDCEAGDIITSEGDDDQTLHFLLKGRVRVKKDGTIIGAMAEPGTLFGEVALLKDGPRTATLVAEDHVYCLRVKSGFLNTLSLAEQHAFSAILYRFLARLLADRLDKTSIKLARAEQMFAEERAKRS